MIKEELDLIKSFDIDTTSRFDVNISYNNWLREYYQIYKKHVPNEIKKRIKETKILWIKDEFAIFRILSREYLESG